MSRRRRSGRPSPLPGIGGRRTGRARPDPHAAPDDGPLAFTTADERQAERHRGWELERDQVGLLPVTKPFFRDRFGVFLDRMAASEVATDRAVDLSPGSSFFFFFFFFFVSAIQSLRTVLSISGWEFADVVDSFASYFSSFITLCTPFPSC